MILAPKLKPGDKIGFISPSSPAKEYHEKYQAGIRVLEKLGFNLNRIFTPSPMYCRHAQVQ